METFKDFFLTEADLQRGERTSDSIYRRAALMGYLRERGSKNPWRDAVLMQEAMRQDPLILDKYERDAELRDLQLRAQRLRIQGERWDIENKKKEVENAERDAKLIRQHQVDNPDNWMNAVPPEGLSQKGLSQYMTFQAASQKIRNTQRSNTYHASRWSSLVATGHVTKEEAEDMVSYVNEYGWDEIAVSKMADIAGSVKDRKEKADRAEQDERQADRFKFGETRYYATPDGMDVTVFVGRGKNENPAPADDKKPRQLLLLQEKLIDAQELGADPKEIADLERQIRAYVRKLVEGKAAAEDDEEGEPEKKPARHRKLFIESITPAREPITTAK